MYVFEVKEDRYLLRLVRGEELMQTLRQFAEERKIGCGVIRGIGAAEKGEVSFYDLEQKTYVSTPLGEVEVAGLIGNLTRGPEGEAAVHIHGSFSGRDGSALGGHVDSLTVGPTLEVDVEVFPGELRRKFDETIGLNLQEHFSKD